MNMKKFILKYNTDPEFKEFIDSVNRDSDLTMNFIFDLYVEYGHETYFKVTPLIEPSLLNIENLIKYFEDKGEFEKCHFLVKIKEKL